MTWLSGDRLTARGGAFRVLRCTPFRDCSLLDLSSETSADTRSLLLPFDRPRPIPARRPLVVSRRAWAHQVSRLLRTSHPFGGLQFCPPAIRLLPYQLEPALASLRHGALRLLVADDVGLGKTVEAGLVVREVAMAAPLSRTLIVCPASVREQWAQELATLFGLTPVIADAAWLRRAARELPADVNPWAVPGIHLASMDFVKRPEALHSLEQLRWDLLVVDEAHAATRTSHRHAAIHALGCRSRRLILLTATPHSGNSEEFDALCGLGAGRNAPPLVVFSRSRGEAPLAPLPARSLVLPVDPRPAELLMHSALDSYTARLWLEAKRRRDGRGELVATVLRKRALSSPFALALSLRRRLQLLSSGAPPAAQLPLPWQDDEAVEDAPPDSLLSLRGWDDEREERRVLEEMAGVAEEASRDESKLRVLKRLLRRVREPALVFSEYRDTAERIRQQLTDAGHGVRLLHGGLTPRERAAAAGAFNAGGLVLVATDAASEGLNLHHACRLVVHFELPWTPSRLHQRCGRVNRIGQTRRVHEIAIVAAHTAEQAVIAPLIRRAERAGPFVRSALASRLTESHIAARVVGGAPLEGGPDPGPSTAVVTMDLSEEACCEADRLETIRRLDPRSRLAPPGRVAARGWRSPCSTAPGEGGHAPGRRGRRALAGRAGGAGIPIARSKRQWKDTRGSERAWVWVAATIALREAGGPAFDRVVVWIEIEIDVEMAAVVWPRDHARLRAQVMSWVERLEPLVRRAAGHVVAARLAAVLPCRAAVIDGLAQREADMRGHLPSTARQLVQAGLFDRRAMRAAAGRASAVDVLEDDWGARVGDAEGSGAPVEVGCDVSAVLLGGWG
jgi:superfamily II DNA or RNA helicase